MDKLQQKDMVTKATKLYEEVFKFAFRKTKDRDAAQDIAQSVMESAVSKMHTLRDTAALRSWIMQITANQIKAYFRELEKYRDHVAMPQQGDDADMIMQLQDLETDILGGLASEESRHNVVKALLLLDRKYQEIVRDHVVYELPLAVIAEKRALNYNTVKTRYKRGIESLRQEFERIEGGGDKNGK